MPIDVLTSGICVSPGVVRGQARVINQTEDLHEVREGEILVVPNSHPMFAIAVMKSSAVICENGGKLSHICIVAMEMGIPCITQAPGATSRISSGQAVWVDATEGVVYADA